MSKLTDSEKKFLNDQEIAMQGGKYYLPVAARVVLFRRDNPTWTIMTQLMGESDKEQMFRAEVADDSHRIIATAHKTVVRGKKGPAGKFPLESAETGAIGRALQLVGYGTLYGELDEGDQIADAPQNKELINNSI